MGTWGEGLYDNDAALDTLGNLFDKVMSDEPAECVAAVGLRLWLHDAPIEDFADELAQHSGWLEENEEVSQALAAIESDQDGSRSEELLHILGSYCDGPRVSVLLGVSGTAVMVERLSRLCRDSLNEKFVPSGDLYQLARHVSPLGVLAQLRQGGFKTDVSSEEVDAWESVVRRCDRATQDERGFWDSYVDRLRSVLRLLL